MIVIKHRRPRIAIGVVIAAGVLGTASTASAQNDWQFPDPYFGIIEIEKSHGGRGDPSTRGRQTTPARPARVMPPALWQPTPAGAGTASEQAAPATKPRWRSRWRRP